MDLQELSDRLFNEIHLALFFEWGIDSIHIDRACTHFYFDCTCHAFMYNDQQPPGIIWHRDAKNACLPHKLGKEV